MSGSLGGYLQPTSPPPAEDGALGKTLHDLIAGVTAIPGNLVFPRWQTNPPTMPSITTDWAAVGIIHTSPAFGAWPEQRFFAAHNPANDRLVQYQHMLIEVVGTFYGPNAGYYASLFHDSLTIRQNLEVLGQSGVKLHMVGDITRAPELINTQYVNRADVTFHLVREITRAYTINRVLSADVELNVQTGEDTAFVEHIIEPPTS